MNTILKTLSYQIIFLVLIGGLSSSIAQTTKESAPEARAQRWDDWMKVELTLSPEQEGKVHDVNLKYAKKNDELKSTSGSKKSKFQELKTNDTDKDAELKGILTKDQFDTYLEKKKAFQKEMLRKLQNSK